MRMAKTMARGPSSRVTGRRAPSSSITGALGPERFAEVAAHDLAEPLEVLDVDRAVEPELGPELVEVLAVGLLLEHELDHVARASAGAG